MSLNEKAIPLRFNSFLPSHNHQSVPAATKRKRRSLPAKIDKWFTGDEAQILISTLEEELSTRFNLIARSAVNRAFKQAVSSLPQEQCTEENCLLRMQEILEVNLIFTFGVLKSDMTTLLTLQLQEGPKKL